MKALTVYARCARNKKRVAALRVTLNIGLQENERLLNVIEKQRLEIRILKAQIAVLEPNVTLLP